MDAPVPGGGWTRCADALYRLLCRLLAVLLVALIVSMLLPMIARHAGLAFSTVGVEEIARLLFVWVVMVGAMIALRDGAHFSVDFWPRMSPRADARLALVGAVASLVLALVFVVAGWEFTRFALGRVMAMTGLPLWLVHVAWPLLGLAWLVFQGERMQGLWHVASARSESR